MQPVNLSVRGRLHVANEAEFSMGRDAWLLRDYQIDVEQGGAIRIGAGVHIGEDARFHAMAGSKIVIHEDCWLNHSVEISARVSVEILQGARVGPNVYIIDHTHEMRRNVPIRDQGYKLGKMVIGSHSWLGARAILLPGALSRRWRGVSGGCRVNP